jgi:hypothetical protein
MKRWLLNKLLKHLFNAITEDDFLTFRDGQLFLGKKPLNNEAVGELQSQASLIKNLKLWELLNSEMKYGAQEMMFNKALSYQDMTAGKWMLYTLDVMNSKLTNLINLK